jgi:hypothetical protein
MVPAAQQTFGDQVAGGLGQVAGQIAMLPFTRGAGLYAQGADAIGEKIDGDNAPQWKKDIATVTGAGITGVTEKWALDKLLGPMATPIKNQIAASLARIGIGAAAEGGQEFSENLLHDVTRKALTNRDAEINVGQSVEEAGVGAAVGGIVRTIVEAGLHIKSRGQEAQQTGQMTELLAGLNKMAEASKLRERDTETAQGFFQSVLAEGRDAVFITPEALAQSGLAEQMAQAIPAVQEQLETAAETGHGIRIPIADLMATMAGPELEQSILPHIAVEPGGFTPTTAQEYLQSDHAKELQAEVERVLGDKETDDTFKTSAEVVKTTVKDQLTAAGRFTESVNDAYASMVGNFYSVQAARMGTTPEAMFAKYPLRIGAESIAGQQFDQSEVRDLIVQHNLTSDNLLHAHRMGGIPVPSLAVTKAAHPLTGFGDISLIGSKDMVDPKGYAAAKVFGADIYSPRYPRVNSFVERKPLDALNKKLDELRTLTGATYIDRENIANEGVREIENNAAVMAQFLKDRGTEPNVVRGEIKPLPPALEGFKDDTRFKHELIADPAFVDAAWKAHEDTLVKAYDGDREAAAAEVAQQKENGKARGVDFITSQYANDINAYQRQVRENGKPDRNRTEAAMRVQMDNAGLLDDFSSYAKDVLQSLNPEEKIFQGYTYSGNRKYQAHTLENVVKILKKELRGGENFNYGVGSLRAKFTPQFKSIEQIRKAKDRLMDKEAFKKVKEEIDDDLIALSNEMGLSLDQTIGALEDAPKMGFDKAVKIYDSEIELSQETKQKAAEFLTRLRNLPTEYFEAKILRDVDIAEFAGAVVPEGANPKALQALQERGVTDIKFYKNGDEADRAAKIQEFENLLFQNKQGARGSFNPATLQLTLLKNADLSTFLHESGHFFLEVQADLAGQLQQDANIHGLDTLKPGEQQVLKDMQATLEWFGLKDLNEWNNLDFEEKRSYHETFARGFEAYLFEGTAPSIEMQGVFQRFRAWLLNVYKDMKALNVELTDEVRGVFDRMLATSEQITLAEQGRSMMPLFTAPEQIGMTPAEFADYQALGVDATNEAIEELQARGLRDMQWIHNARGRIIKQLQKESAAKRAEVQMEVRSEVMAQPIYRAWQFLTGKITEDDKIEPIARAKSDPNVLDETLDSLFVAIAKLGGIKKDDVVTSWGVDPADKPTSGVFGKPLWRREGGLSIDGMAEALSQYGYLEKDEHGKWDIRDLEEKFKAELGGDLQHSTAYDYAGQQDPGRAGDQIPNPLGLSAGRLDRASLSEIGLPPEIIAHLDKLRMVKKDSLHPDLVAEMLGFTSGDELVRKLAAAETPKVEIEALTDVRMLERFGDLSSQQAIERAADKAIHNDVRARMLATELNALDKATGRPKTLASAAKTYAAAMIARIKVRNIKPSQYASAEVRAGKASEKASKAGDLATAAAEKRNQLINNYATRAAYDAQDEVERGLRYLKSFDSAGKRKGLDADYTDQIDALLERFDLRKGVSGKAIDKRKALAEWLTAQRDAGLEPDVPPTLVNEAFRKSYKELTVEEMRGLIDTIKQIEHLGRLKHKLLTARDQRAYEAVRDEIAGSIHLHAQGREADTRTPTTNMGRAVQGLKRFWASHIKAATWARVMDGGIDGGPMWEYFVRSANERGDQETTMRAEATGKLSQILAPVFKLGRMGGKGQFFASINRSLNRESRIALALNVGNAGNLQRLLGGEGWNVAQIAPVLQSLTAQEWAAVQAVWDHFESYRPQIAAKERRVYGKEPEWVAATPFVVTTADGQSIQMRGGYYPVKYDPAASQRAEEHNDAEAAKRQLQGAYTTATTRRSFTKSRVEEVNGRPLLYTLSGMYSGVNDVIHDLAWHEWLIDANRLLRSGTIDNAIRDHYGPETKQQFKTWVQDVAEGEKGADAAVDLAVARLRQGVSAAGLGFNVMSALIQPLGITQSIVRVGAPYIGRGLVKYLASPLGATREAVAMSSFMENRARTRFRELNELRNQVQDETVFKQIIGRYAYFLMMRCQQMVDVPTWHGAYEKAIAEGNDEDLAINLADQAVIDAQGGGQTKDLSAIERGGPTQKLFTVFYSFMNTALNLGVGQTMAADTPAKKAKLAADYALLYVVPAVLGYFLKAAITPGDSGDDDPEKIAKKLAANQIDYLMGLMVVVREFGEAAKLVSGANDMGRSYSGPAGVRVISDVGTLATQVHQGEFDDAFRKAAINTIGGLFGLPSAQINRTITGTKALAEGKTNNPAAVAFGFQEKR